MKKYMRRYLLVRLLPCSPLGVYSLAIASATGSASEKREFIRPRFP